MEPAEGHGVVAIVNLKPTQSEPLSYVSNAVSQDSSYSEPASEFGNGLRSSTSYLPDPDQDLKQHTFCHNRSTHLPKQYCGTYHEPLLLRTDPIFCKMGDVEGASPREQILEACRRDNVELFEEVLGSMKSQSKEQIAEFFNKVTDTMGNYLLHVCANYGSYDVMDELLNIEFLECDPLTRKEKETPIHRAVSYANEREVELGEAMAKMLIDAGGDPRLKDSHGRKPSDICTPRAESLRIMLRREEYIANEGLKDSVHEEDEGPTGSASDSE